MPSGESPSVPNDFQNLDELAVPPPVNADEAKSQPLWLEGTAVSPSAELNEAKKQRLWLGHSADNLRDSTRGKKTAVQPESAVGAEEKYDEPSDYDNLDEVAAPPPIDPEEARKEEHLEDRSNRSTPEHPDEGDLGRQHVSRLATELYTISYLVFFSILGTLARLGLQALTFYPGAPVQTGLLWANVGGSLIMGFLSEDRKLFMEEWGDVREVKPKDTQALNDGQEMKRTPSIVQKHGAVKKTIPLYIGLATGFCGSFTSFSSFMRDVFYALANALPVPINHPSSAPISQTINVHRNPGYSFMATLAVLIVTVGLSLGALQVGAHLALSLDPFTPSIPFLLARKVVDRTMVILAWGCWLGAILMAILPPDRSGGSVAVHPSTAQEMWRSKALFALVFAPLGCLLRFYASLRLNGRMRAFPLGTFTVNIVGSALQAMFIDLQRAPVGGLVGCQVLQGLEDGFCGCLTTVSTWVSELKALRLRHAYFYGAMSIGVGLSCMIVIMGSLLWSQGYVTPLCVT